jgi:hypothetical protein
MDDDEINFNLARAKEMQSTLRKVFRNLIGELK